MSDATPAAPAAGGKKKLLVIVLIVLVLLLAAGGAGAFLLLKKQHAADDEGDGHGQTEQPVKKKKARKPEQPPVFVPLDNFVVNLADRDADRYLQLGVTLQVEDAKVGEQIKGYMPAIRNNILLLLSRKTTKDLAEHDGKELLALQVRAAAVRGMGIDVDEADFEPQDEAAAPSQKRKRRYDPTADWPIEAVQFSSLLIQ